MHQLIHKPSTMSHFSYAPLIKCKITQKSNMIFLFRDYQRKAHLYLHYHCDFIVIRSETNEKMDLEGHYPQNTISHCIISNETQFTLHLFQVHISAMPEIRADLFLAISKTGMCLLTSSCFQNVLLFWFSAGQGLKKVGFNKKNKNDLYDSE